MVFISKKHLSRRTFLRGAGVAMALPFLESMMPAATAIAKTAANPRSRLACIYFPHGATMEKWTPAVAGTNFEFTEILQPLAPFRERINIISDLGLPLAYGSDGSAGANHTRSSAVFLCGAHPGTGAQAHLGITVDQLAAQKIGQDTPLPSIELCIEDGSLSCGEGLSCAYRNTISWQSPTSPLPMENNPQVVFERLFGDGSTDAERRARREQSASLLDSVMSDVASLRKQLPAADRARLNQYLDDVREIERRIKMAGQQIPADLKVPEKPVGLPDDFETHIKLMFDLQVLAWQAEITRVTTLMFAKEVSGATYPRSGVRDSFHNLSHHSNIQANKDRFAVLNRYHVSMFAYLLEKLKAIPDGDGNLLDHSMILYGSGISDGNQHNHDPLPIILAGGAAGQLKGGRHIRQTTGQGAGAPKIPLSNLQVAMLNKLGVTTEKFGDSTGVLNI
jgi:hypothetical protein